MPVYVVAQGRIENRERLAEYEEKAIASIAAHGGKLIAYDEDPEIVEGTVDARRTVILEFGSREAFRTWYDSPEYQKALPLRLEAAPGSLIVVEGLDRDRS